MTDAAAAEPLSDRDVGFMALAIESARRGARAGEPPVGACLVRDGRVIARTHNAVMADIDITAHAEIRVIRHACSELRSLDLGGARLFVTVEPCPMCLGACHYAGIGEIVFGAGLSDMNRYTGGELVPDDPAWRETLAPAIRFTGGVRRDECVALLRDWAERLTGS